LISNLLNFCAIKFRGSERSAKINYFRTLENVGSLP